MLLVCARGLREQALAALSKRGATPRRPGVYECERIGPYIGKVTIFVEAETEPALKDLMRAVGRLGALEYLLIGEEFACTNAGKRPCADWRWLTVVTQALQEARDRLPRLREVWLRGFMAGKWVGVRDGSEVGVPPPPTEWVHDFICALPPGLTKLQLGPDFTFKTCGLSSEAYASVLKLLETGVLPNLRAFVALMTFDHAVYDALISMLRHAPFAPQLEVLQLGDPTYDGPKDLTALVEALARCPKLKNFALGRGSGEAKHYFDFMKQIISGQLPDFDHIPFPTDLPAKLRTYEEMDAAVSLIIEGLQAGRFRDTLVLNLGDDPSQVALPDASFDRLLSGTPPEALPQLVGAMLRCVPGPALGRVGDWMAQHKTLRSFMLYCGGLKRGGKGEGHITQLLERLMEDPELERLKRVELVWMNQPAEKPAPNAGKTKEEAAPCCLLKAMDALPSKIRERRLPPRGQVIEVSLAFTRDVMPDDEEREESGRVLPCVFKSEDESIVEHERFCKAREPVRVTLNLVRKAKAELLWDQEPPVGLRVSYPSLPRRSKWMHGGGKKPRIMVTERFALFSNGKVMNMTTAIAIQPHTLHNDPLG